MGSFVHSRSAAAWRFYIRDEQRSIAACSQIQTMGNGLAFSIDPKSKVCSSHWNAAQLLCVCGCCYFAEAGLPCRHPVPASSMKIIFIGVFLMRQTSEVQKWSAVNGFVIIVNVVLKGSTSNQYVFIFESLKRNTLRLYCNANFVSLASRLRKSIGCRAFDLKQDALNWRKSTLHYLM